MFTFKKGKINSLLWMFLLLAILFVAGNAEARRSKRGSASGAIDAKTFEVLSKAQKLAEQSRFAEALKKLDSIKDSKKILNNGYAKSQMWNFYAYIYASQEKYREAVSAYQKILAEPEAPDGLKLQSKYTIAQLYFQLEDYDSVISLMKEWLKNVEKPTSTAHIMLAQAYYQKSAYDNALINLDKAVKINKAEGKTEVKENWLRMKAAIYYEKNDPKNTLVVYKELFRLYPKMTYLKQIAGLYGEVGNNRRRLTTYDAVYLHGDLKRESEVLNLAYMYMGQGVPYKAGRIIEEGMKSGIIEASQKNTETLANAWAQANEHKKAIPTLERSASLSDKGLLYARLAGVYFDAGDFKKAALAAKKADKKGGLKQAGGNMMLLGMALFNVKEYEEALQAFRRAKDFKKSFRDARKWEKYTLSEIARLRQLEKNKLKLIKDTEKAMTAEENAVENFGKHILKNESDPAIPNNQ
ncbi:MAG: tetratricopeptide repeat protein [Desulfobacteraceae bacterium]